MPGDRMSVPVVVRAAGPKFETDTAEHLLAVSVFRTAYRLYLDGRGDAVRIAVAERGGRRVFRIAAAGSIVRYALLVSFAAVPMAGTHFRVAGRKVWNNG